MKQKELYKTLDQAGITTPHRRGLSRPVPSRELYKPAIITLEGEYLVYSFAPDLQIHNMGEELPPPQPLSASASIVYPAADLLDGFLKFAEKDATSGQIVDFAQRYGVLELCEHHLPGTHWDVLVTNPASIRMPGCQQIGHPEKPAYFQEPIQDWKNLAGGFRAILQAAAHLHQDQSVPVPVWEVICSMGTGTKALLTTDPAYVQRYESTSPTERLASHRTLFNRVINWLLQVANVRTWFWWSDTGTGIEFGGPGLFGHLVLQLVLAVSRKDGFAFCTECGREYLITRAPARNRSNYCGICRNDGAPQRKASRRYWQKTGWRKRQKEQSKRKKLSRRNQ